MHMLELVPERSVEAMNDKDLLLGQVLGIYDQFLVFKNQSDPEFQGFKAWTRIYVFLLGSVERTA